MEYVAHKFEHTAEGLVQKEAYATQLAAQGYRVISEKREKAEIKTDNQGCLSFLGLSLTASVPAAPDKIVVTYGRETTYCAWCGIAAGKEQRVCDSCQTDLWQTGYTDWASARLIAERRKEAARRTAEINQRLDEVTGILSSTLAQDHHFDWSSLKEEFSIPEPHPPVREEPPAKPPVLHLTALFPFLEDLFAQLRVRRIAWESAGEEAQQLHRSAFAQYQKELDEWLKARDSFEQEQTAQADKNRRACLAKDAAMLLRYWQIVLERSKYPEGFPRASTFDYASAEQRLTVEFTLPPVSVLPEVGEVRYNPVLHTVEDVHVSQVWFQETYNELAIQLTFRIAYELFTSDVVDAVSSIVFHGRRQPVDKYPDETVNPILLSVAVTKAEFNKLDLAHLNPMICFQRLGGVLSENLAAGRPIKAISG